MSFNSLDLAFSPPAAIGSHLRSTMSKYEKKLPLAAAHERQEHPRPRHEANLTRSPCSWKPLMTHTRLQLKGISRPKDFGVDDNIFVD
jgi:hypothetical protein